MEMYFWIQIFMRKYLDLVMHISSAKRKEFKLWEA